MKWKPLRQEILLMTLDSQPRAMLSGSACISLVSFVLSLIPG